MLLGLFNLVYTVEKTTLKESIITFCSTAGIKLVLLFLALWSLLSDKEV